MAKQRPIQESEQDESLEYTFLEFYAIWTQMQRWDIPDVHQKIIAFLEDENWEELTKVLLIWRGVGKSTILDLWVAYKLSKNPKLRFTLVSADHNTAKKSTQDTLSIIRRHPLCVHLISDKEETKKDSFHVKGHFDDRNASFYARGITSNATGGRSDYVIFDDVEVPKNSGTDTKRSVLRSRIDEYNHILTPEYGFKLFIGTYHDEVSVYDDQIKRGASKLRIPVIKNYSGEFPYIKGESNWPERFDNELIASRQKNCAGRAEFLSQYLLIPSSINESRLDPTLIQYYDHEIEFLSSNGSTLAKIGDHIISTVSCFWDPALSKAERDDSVLAIVYTSTEGKIFVHRTIRLVGDAEEQCTKVKQVALSLHIPIVLIEKNGIGAFLPQLLLKHLTGTGIGVDGIATSTNKNIKIIESLETPLYGHFLYAHESVRDGKFPNQIRDFNPSSQKIKDDYIDAVASAIKNEPVRIAVSPTSFTSKINNWASNGSVDMERELFQL